ncbi:hypothetical protein ACQI4L_12485 [Mycolicibacterium litorale]|uniref:hypothetical protein n=1 Tax=Mycolicibacterium litorale TaxID=758802 RepID=UPI003CEE0A21
MADNPDISDVMVPTEEVHPDHREHAKEPRPIDDDELARRVEHERDITGADKPADNV